jgi:DNA-binding beta-propeller fold protein YncE
MILLVVICALLPSAARSQLPFAFCTQWGSYGTGDGQFQIPAGIAVDASGNVYVADSRSNRIQVFTGSGGYITQLGSYGTGPGQFWRPYGVAVDAGGDVYVADSGNHRIQKFCYGPIAVQNTTWGRVKSMFR